MFDNGLDIGAVFRHPVFMATFGVGIPAWVVAFASQCALEAKKVVTSVDGDGESFQVGLTSTGAKAGTLWFAIWVQLFVTIFLFLSCAADTLALYRMQFSVFLAVALVLGVDGVNTHIYAKGWGASLATAAGWLLCSMVDIVWILYLTSEEGSFLYDLFNSGGTGGISGWSGGAARRRSAHAGAHAGAMDGYGSEVSGLRQGAADRGMSSHDMASSQNGYTMSGYGGSGQLDPPRVPPPVTMPASTSRDEFSTAASPSVADVAAPKQRAKANYAYTASPDDPNEVSFAKGEILEVMDTTGKWFQVRTSAGQAGIAPSNYLTLL